MIRKVAYVFFSLFALLFAGGCREMDCVENIDSSHARNSIYLNLSLLVNDGGSSNSRSTGEGEIPGTNEENRIHSLYMYIFNSENGNLVYRSDITNLEQSDKVYSIKLNIDNLPDKVKIYLAANLTSQQANEIINVTAIYKSTATSYTKVINEFAPYKFMPQFGVTGITPRSIGIAMTGQAFSGNDDEFDLHQYTTSANPLPLTSDLKRAIN